MFLTTSHINGLEIVLVEEVNHLRLLVRFSTIIVTKLTVITLPKSIDFSVGSDEGGVGWTHTHFGDFAIKALDLLGLLLSLVAAENRSGLPSV